jgi:tight adherence protein C
MILGIPTILIAIAVGFSLAALLIGISLVPSRSDITKRLEELEGLRWETGTGRSQAFERLFNDKQRGKLAQKLHEAGWYTVTPAKMGARIVAGAIVGATLGVGAMALTSEVNLTYVGMLLLLVIVGAYAPMTLLKRAAKARKTAIEKSLPDLLDMLASTVQAGLTFNAALGYAKDVATGPLGEEVKASLSEMRLGRSRADALRSMAARMHVEQVSTFITAVVQAERLGSNLASVLEELAEETRNRRMMRAEELANMMPTKLVIPMALFMLPALFIMIFGGVVAEYVGK